MVLEKHAQPKHYPPSLLSAVEALYGCRLSQSGDPRPAITLPSATEHRTAGASAQPSAGTHAISATA